MSAPQVFHKILAVKLRSMGDTLLMTASLGALRKAFPQSEIHVLVSSRWAPLLQDHPDIDHLHLVDLPSGKLQKTLSVFRYGLHLRKHRFDCVLNFHASPSSALLCRLTGSPVRAIHFHGLKDTNRYSTVELPPKIIKANSERDLDAVRALGIEVPEGLMPKISLREDEKQRASTQLSDLQRPILGLGLGASRPTKRWPLSHFVSLAQLWKKHTGGSILAFASPDEKETLLDPLSDKIPELRSFPSLDLRFVASLISQVNLFVGNDSGPRHLAVALGVPTLTLFGPESPHEWHPYPQDRHPYFFLEDLECRRDAPAGMPPWCGLSECIELKNRCIRDILPNHVFLKCLEMIDAKNPKNSPQEVSGVGGIA